VHAIALEKEDESEEYTFFGGMYGRNSPSVSLSCNVDRRVLLLLSWRVVHLPTPGVLPPTRAASSPCPFPLASLEVVVRGVVDITSSLVQGQMVEECVRWRGAF
jgi:hypothetical protein